MVKFGRETNSILPMTTHSMFPVPGLNSGGVLVSLGHHTLVYVVYGPAVAFSSLTWLIKSSSGNFSLRYAIPPFLKIRSSRGPWRRDM